MFDVIEAAKARASNARVAVKRIQEELDNARRQAYASKQTAALPAAQLAALEDLIKVEQLRLLQVNGLAELYENIAKGKRVLE